MRHTRTHSHTLSIFITFYLYFDSGIRFVPPAKHTCKKANEQRNINRNLFLPIGEINPNCMHDTNDEIKMRKQLC